MAPTTVVPAAVQAGGLPAGPAPARPQAGVTMESGDTSRVSPFLIEIAGFTGPTRLKPVMTGTILATQAAAGWCVAGDPGGGRMPWQGDAVRFASITGGGHRGDGTHAGGPDRARAKRTRRTTFHGPRVPPGRAGD